MGIPDAPLTSVERIGYGESADFAMIVFTDFRALSAAVIACVSAQQYRAHIVKSYDDACMRKTRNT